MDSRLCDIIVSQLVRDEFLSGYFKWWSNVECSLLGCWSANRKDTETEDAVLWKVLLDVDFNKLFEGIDLYLGC